MPDIVIDHVSKFFTSTTHRRKRFAAINNVSLTIEQGDFVFIIGSSGAGKTTLLRLLAAEIKADQGHIYFGQQDLSKLKRRTRALFLRRIGQVWQEPRLLEKETIRANLELAAYASGMGRKAGIRIEKALSIVGMKNAINQYPANLSGGEVKRVELARALLNSPPVLLLDEVTANLDPDTGWDIMNLLREVNRLGVTVIMVTHAKDFVNIMCKRVVTLVDGRLRGDVQKGRYGDLR